MKSPHGWTLDTLEAFLSTKINSVEKYFNDIQDEREARNKERFDFADKRQEAANNIRAAMIDQQNLLANKEQVSIQLDGLKAQVQETFRRLETRLDAVEKTIITVRGATQGVGLSAGVIVQIISSIASIGAIIGFIMLLKSH